MLIDASGRAVFTDMGLVGVIRAISPSLVTYTAESGAKRYMAPELHEPKKFGDGIFRRTPATDAYSYASLCLEVSVND